MTKYDLKPVYAKNNRDWRIVYMPGGTWTMQEYRKLVEGTDRSRHQPWVNHNGRMTFDSAIVTLATHDKAQAA